MDDKSASNIKEAKSVAKQETATIDWMERK